MPLNIFGTKHDVSALFRGNVLSLNRSQTTRSAHGLLLPGMYMNNRLLASHPGPWDSVVGTMSTHASQLREEYDVIAAVATGGISHAAVIAWKNEVPFVIVKKQEKTHGVGGMIDGDINVLPGARILLIEDMSSTFQSCLNAMEVLEHEGASVAHTLLIGTWNLPVFQRNAENHQVHTMCTGEMLLDYAVERNMVEASHEKVIRRWLKHPEDESWTHDGTWLPPKGETF